METVSLIITAVSILFAIIKKLQDSGNGSSTNSYNADNYLESYEFSKEEKLQNMNINSLVVCYASSTAITHYSVRKATQLLADRSHIPNLIVEEIIEQNNCVYLKLMHGLPFDSSNKCYGASFGIYYMNANKCVSIYGGNTANPAEKETFKKIANEILSTLSR